MGQQKEIAGWKQKYTEAMVENTNDLQRMIGRTEQKHRLDAALQASLAAPGAQSNEKVSMMLTIRDKCHAKALS